MNALKFYLFMMTALLSGAFIDAANAIVSIIVDGPDAAMNKYNRSKEENDESV